MSVDPEAHRYQESSPYNYTLNNPIKYIDPDGRSVTGTVFTADLAVPDPTDLVPWKWVGYGAAFLLETATIILIKETLFEEGDSDDVEESVEKIEEKTSESEKTQEDQDESKGREKGERMKDSDDAHQQYEEVTKAQDKAKKHRPKTKGKDADPEWEGSKRPKQSKIQDTKKSKNRRFP